MTKVRVVKITEDIAERLEKAAAREGLSLTSFVRRAAMLEADRVLTRAPRFGDGEPRPPWDGGPGGPDDDADGEG